MGTFIFPKSLTRWKWPLTLGFTAIGLTFAIGPVFPEFKPLWPSIVALILVFTTRRVFFSLAWAALCGTLLIHQGNLFQAGISIVPDHLFPSFQRPWRIGAILFTITLGGFAALIEAGGGFKSLLMRWTSGLSGGRARRRIQYAGAGLGIICFFDGLANSMILGRVLRSLTDAVQISRERLAYLVDSTSSSIACLAFISTWIAFQLSLIAQEFEAADYDGSVYGTFFQSIPLNAYCLFTILLVFLSTRYAFYPGPMAKAEARARSQPVNTDPQGGGDSLAAENFASGSQPKAYQALIPLAVLVASIVGGFYLWGADSLWPVTPTKIVEAFGHPHGPWILLSGALIASLAAFLMNQTKGEPSRAFRIFGIGMLRLLGPVLILLGAWMLSSVLGALDTRATIRDFLGDDFPVWLLPVAVFLTGAAISFSTGTSWGTMGILMPIALPMAFAFSDGLDPVALQGLLAACVAAVFSGAVFGDHCSPISDTTIVSSVASGVSPHAHVITQLPYALIAAAVAIVFGFLPAGFAWPPWIGLLLGSAILWLICWKYRSGKSSLARTLKAADTA